MGQTFFEKWRKANPESMSLRAGGKEILTNVKICGRYYPCEVKLIEGSAPPTLGKNFFDRYR